MTLLCAEREYWMIPLCAAANILGINRMSVKNFKLLGERKKKSEPERKKLFLS